MELIAIVHHCKFNDRQSQNMFYMHFSRRMFVVCWRYVYDNETAKDMLFKGFYKAFRAIEKFDYVDESSTLNWLTTIMINECLSYLKVRKFDIDRDIDPDEIESSEEIISNITVKEIMALVAKLPPGYRVVFNLCVIEDLDYTEISVMLKIKPSSVRSQLHRARKILQQQIKQRGGQYATD